MSTLKPTRKISRKEKLREDTVATFYARAVDYFDKNRTLVYGLLGVVALVVVAAYGWRYLASQKEQRAEDAMAAAVRNYEQGLYREALDGVAGSLGLVAVADEFGRTTAGNLARFYAADAYFRIGEFDQALEYFRAYDKEEDYLGASALAGEASILEGRGEGATAGRLYERAAGFIDDDEFSAQYLMDAARAFENVGDFNRAVALYQRVEEEYPDAQASRNAQFFAARAQAEAAGQD